MLCCKIYVSFPHYEKDGREDRMRGEKKVL